MECSQCRHPPSFCVSHSYFLTENFYFTVNQWLIVLNSLKFSWKALIWGIFFSPFLQLMSDQPSKFSKDQRNWKAGNKNFKMEMKLSYAQSPCSMLMTGPQGPPDYNFLRHLPNLHFCPISLPGPSRHHHCHHLCKRTPCRGAKHLYWCYLFSRGYTEFSSIQFGVLLQNLPVTF